MPTPVFAGYSANKVPSPLMRTIKIANKGFPFTNVMASYESQTITEREIMTSDFKSPSLKDVLGRSSGHFFEPDIKMTLMQTDLPSMLNWWKLSGTLVQAAYNYVTPGGGSYWVNHVDNAGGQSVLGGTTPPTGSALLGLMPTYEIDDDKTRILLELKGKQTKEETRWQMNAANNAAIATGGTGGTTLGLTATSYVRENNQAGGLNTLLIAGQEVGIKRKGFKMSFKGVDRGGSDDRMRPICNYMQIHGEFITAQFAGDVEAAIYAAYTDQNIVINLLNSNNGIIQLTNSPVSITPTVMYGEKQMEIKWVIEGEVPYPGSWGTAPDSIDWGITTPGTIVINRVGF